MSNIGAVLWDLDHTLYQHDAKIIEELDWALARAAVANGADIELREAFNLSAQSFKETGASHTLFLERFPEISAEKLHDDFHHEMDESHIVPFFGLPALFEKQPSLEHFVITHSARHWAERVVDFIGLGDHIPVDHIVDFREMDYSPKHKNYDLIDRMIAQSGLQPHQIAMAEDTIKNLKPAHDRGLVTIYIHNNEKLPQIPDYVDHVVEDANKAMELIESLNNPQPGQQLAAKRPFKPS